MSESTSYQPQSVPWPSAPRATGAAGAFPRGTSVEAVKLPLLALLALWIVLIRLPFLGFDVLSVDESVYLLIGSGLRHGLVPYVDIVDRKPIGIFLIYAAAEALFDDPLIGVRVFGLLSTFVAGALIMWIGQRFLRLKAEVACLGAIFYATYALLFYGDSGQTPVYYMPLVIAGAGLVMCDAERLMRGAAPEIPRLALAGLLLGLSLQIKYTTVFECVCFGGLILFLAWSKRSIAGPGVIRAALVGAASMVFFGLLPTVVAYAAFAAAGYGDAFLFYNFTSNLTRDGTDFPIQEIASRASMFVLALLPLTIMSLRYLLQAAPSADHRGDAAPARWPQIVMAIWAVVALFGALAQRQPYATYFFNTLAPLAIMAAAAFQQPSWSGRVQLAKLFRNAAVLALLPVVGYAGMHAKKIVDNGAPHLPSRIADDIKSLGAQSMFNFNYYGIEHYFTGIPLPSPYPYPDHLLRDLEGRSFQFDGRAEIARILSGNPAVILVQRPISPKITADRREMVESTLARAYCRWRVYGAGAQSVEVYLNRAFGPQDAKACGRTG